MLDMGSSEKSASKKQLGTLDKVYSEMKTKNKKLKKEMADKNSELEKMRGIFAEF